MSGNVYAPCMLMDKSLRSGPSPGYPFVGSKSWCLSPGLAYCAAHSNGILTSVVAFVGGEESITMRPRLGVPTSAFLFLSDLGGTELT